MFSFKKNYFIIVCFILLISPLLNFYPAYAFVPEKDFEKYQKDNESVHPYFGFKKADGQFFCLQNLNFYGVEGVPCVSCCSYQEWLNKKQATKDVISFGASFIPFVGGIVGVASDIADVTGTTDVFINENRQQIATLIDFIYLRLLENQGKGFFFFDVNQLNDIQEVKVSFCDCDVYSCNIEDIMEIMQKSHWHRDLISMEFKNKTSSIPRLTYESYAQEQIRDLVKKVASGITQKIYNKIKKKV